MIVSLKVIVVKELFCVRKMRIDLFVFVQWYVLKRLKLIDGSLCTQADFIVTGLAGQLIRLRLLFEIDILSYLIDRGRIKEIVIETL